MVYLVIQYDKEIIYLPFKDIASVDAFTVGYDNLLELAASVGDIVKIGIPNSEIVDVYLSSSMEKVNDDMQEFDKRSLAVKYSRDNYSEEEVRDKFVEYLSKHAKKFDNFRDFKAVLNNYKNKYGNSLGEDDIVKIAKLYFGNNYNRFKEWYFKLRDKGYKFKNREHKVKYSSDMVKQIQEDNKMALVMLTGYSEDELHDYVISQIKKGQNDEIHR